MSATVHPYPISRSARWVARVAETIAARPEPLDAEFWKSFKRDYRRKAMAAGVSREMADAELSEFADQVFATIWESGRPQGGDAA